MCRLFRNWRAGVGLWLLSLKCVLTIVVPAPEAGLAASGVQQLILVNWLRGGGRRCGHMYLRALQHWSQPPCACSCAVRGGEGLVGEPPPDGELLAPSPQLPPHGLSEST
jgi:hypothetical protein